MLQLYENIKKYRRALGMTQQELAELVGYSGGKSMISKIEAGKVDLPQSKIKHIASVLNVTASDLMGWDQEKINDAIKKQDSELAVEFADEEEVRQLLVEMPKENLQQVKLILAYHPSLTELEDLADYVRFLVSKRKDTDGKAEPEKQEP